MIPEFRFIPVMVSGAGNAVIGAIRLRGVSTKHGATNTDAGKMFGAVSRSGENVVLSLWNKYRRMDTDLMASGTMIDLHSPFELVQANESGISGDAIVSEFSADSKFAAIVSFATDQDIQSSQSAMENYPGYDATYGAAIHLASAMEQIITSSLPSMIPGLFDSQVVRPFEAITGGAQIPNISLIQNPGALRRATANLAKSMAWEEAAHLDEAQEIIKSSRMLFDMSMKEIMEANAPKELDAANAVESTISFTSFRR